MPYLFFDYYYIVLVIPALIIAMYAQFKVKSTYSKYEKQMSRRGLSAADVTRQILNQNGLQHISIEQIGGNLTDHYDPRSNVIRLSQSVYYSTSVAAIGVAAHEAGHAVQHATGYVPIKLRNAVLPVANFGSKLAMPLIILGFIMSMDPLVNAGILLFGAIVLFQLVTLPVEFNASSRAIATLDSSYILEGEEIRGAKKVLSAAALTYVAATLVAIMQLLRLILISRRNND